MFQGFSLVHRVVEDALCTAMHEHATPQEQAEIAAHFRRAAMDNYTPALRYLQDEHGINLETRNPFALLNDVERQRDFKRAVLDNRPVAAAYLLSTGLVDPDTPIQFSMRIKTEGKKSHVAGEVGAAGYCLLKGDDAYLPLL